MSSRADTQMGGTIGGKNGKEGEGVNGIIFLGSRSSPARSYEEGLLEICRGGMLTRSAAKRKLLSEKEFLNSASGANQG